METALPICTATEIFCSRKVVSRGSPVSMDIRLPSSLTNANPSQFRGPRVSIAMTTKRWLGGKSWYFCCLEDDACFAAAPAWVHVDGKLDAARESGTVASQARYLPLDQGISVLPSGLRLDPGINPVGSRVALIFALPNALWMMLLPCLRCRPALLLHDKPWFPRASTCEPQWQVWGMQMFAPKRSPVDTLMASLVIRKPTAVMGGTLS